MLPAQRFNEAQARRLLATSSYIDKLLLEIEEILSASSSGGFPKYKNPLAPAQVRVVRDYIKRLRQQIIRVLADLEIPLPEPRFDSTFSIKVTLQFIQIALEEIAPRRLQGYGMVPESLIKPLAGGIQEMTGIVRQMDSYLNQPIEVDLSNRLGQLRGTDIDVSLLKKLGDIVERHSLVEFRAPLSQLVDKIEFPVYEIAFFGRVSTGKSSLLNAIIGANLLPVGVTPITAVPTRIKNGPASQLLVWSAEGRFAKYPAEQLPEFVTEAQNPGNQKRITRLLIEIPLPILPDEVLLVDTPGLGSFALEGASETLAYLPNCDLGVVLVDATSNLQADDVATVDALRAASVPALVVLSKADLVPEQDRQLLLDYTRTQLRHQLNMGIDVALLSSHPESASLLQQWVARQITPRVADARRLSRESNQRKLRSLAQGVLRALEVSAKTTAVPSDKLPDDLKAVETQLRDVASLIEETSEHCFELTDQVRDNGESTLDRLAESALAYWQKDPDAPYLDNLWVARQTNQLAQAEAERLASLIQITAQELTSALDRAASVLSTGDREARFTLQNFVKDMPPADYAPPAVRLNKPQWFRLSARLAKRSIRSQLDKRLVASIREFFTSYGRTLEVWLRGALDNVAREFETHGDVYRAQFQRLNAGALSHDDVPAERVLEDVASLKRELDLEEPKPIESSASIL
ncbi:MAG: dynamin family protein [Bryobacteraceae bacterium]